MIAVIVAGGKGTRLKEISRAIPKPMIPLCGKPVLEHQMELLKRYGAREVYLLTGYLGHVIEDHFGHGERYGLTIRYHREKEPLGTAGCVAAIKGLVNEPFLLLYGDIMLDMKLDDLFAFHREKGGAATVVVHPNDHPHDSDLVVMTEDGLVQGFIPKNRKPAYYPNRVSAAVYVLSTAVFRHIPSGSAADFVKDVFPSMLSAGERIFGYKTAEYVKDMGTTERYHKVSRDFESGKIRRSSRRHRRPAIFIDRDGTLVEEVDLLHRVEELRVFPFSAPAVKRINDSEFLSFVATNQPVVARNLCDLEKVGEIHRKLETILGEQGAYLDDIYFCPHHPDTGYPEENPVYKVDCDCRKPKTGMIEAAAREYLVDLASSWIIGDRTTDIQTGINAGLTTALVRTGLGGKDGRFDAWPDFSFDTLDEAVEFIVSQRGRLLEAIVPIVRQVESRQRETPLVIAVGGQSRSGKSTLVALLRRALAGHGICARVLSLDNWLVSAEERTDDMTVRERYRYKAIEQDIGRLLAGQEIELGCYDPYRRSTGPGAAVCLNGAACLVVDGVAALDIAGLREAASFRLFIEAPEEVRRRRFFAFYRWKDMPEHEIEALYVKRLRDEVPIIDATRQHAHQIIRS